MQRARYSRRWRVESSSPATVITDRVTCAVCRFPGVNLDYEPAAHLGLKASTTNGTTYIGTAANAAISTFDKEVVPVRRPGECDFCGAELYLDGRRGSGLRVPQ